MHGAGMSGIGLTAMSAWRLMRGQGQGHSKLTYACSGPSEEATRAGL